MNESNCVAETDNITCQMDELYVLPAASVKHNITMAKVKERIEKLYELYQIQNGGINSMEFCGTIAGDCARTTSFPARWQGSSGLLRVSEVENEVGPQTTGIDPGCSLPVSQAHGFATATDVPSTPAPLFSPPTNTLVPPALCSEAMGSLSEEIDVKPNMALLQQVPQDLQERIQASEAALNITPSQLTDLYQRQRNIESMLLQLKDGTVPVVPPPSEEPPHETYSDDITLDDVNEEIWSLTTSLKLKKLKNTFGE